MARLARWAVYLGISVLFLAAMGVSLGRYLVAYLPQWTPELERAASDALGAKVSLGTLAGSWRGPDPGVTVRDASVRHPWGQVRIGHIRLELDLWRSLMQRQPVFTQLDIRGVDIYSTHPLKDWPELLQGVTGESSESGAGWPGLSQLTLRDVRLMLPGDKTNQTWSLPALTLGRSADHRRLWLEAQLNSPDGTPSGQVVISSAHSGNLKAWLRLPDVSSWQPVLEQFWPDRLYKLEGDVALWATYGEGQWRELAFETQGLKAGFMSGTMCLAPASLSSYAATLRLDGTSWVLKGGSGRLSWADQSMALSPLTLSQRDEKYDLQMAHVELEPLSRALVALGVNGELSGYLSAYAPEGRLANIHLYADEQSRYTLEAALQGVAARAVDGAPAGRNINGILRANAQGGWVQFSSGELTLAFPELYSHGWRFRRASGRVQWRIGEDRDDIWGESITLEPAGGGRIQGQFALASNAGRPDLFSLDLRIDQLPVRQAPDYVPDKAVSPGLMSWLRAALQNGTVASAHYRYDGYVGEGAAPSDRISLLNADVRDLALEFSQGWPALEASSVRIGLSDGDLDVHVPEGQVGLTQVSDLSARLRDRAAQGLVLNLAGKTRISRAAQQWWLNDSPMAGDLPDGICELLYSESLDGRIQLDLPLEQGTPQLSFSLDFDGGRLSGLPDPVSELEDLNGQLVYTTANGLQANKLTARWRGTPVSARIESLARPQRVKIHARLDAGATFWQTVLGEKLMARFEGSTPLELEAELPGEDTWEVRVSSNLKGVAVTLPEPLAKPDAAAAQRVLLEVKPEGDGIGILLQYGERGAQGWIARALQDRQGLRLVVSDAGPETILALPRPGGLDLQFERLDLKPWHELLESLGASTDSARDAFSRYHLEAKVARYADKTLSDLDVTWQPEEKGWRLSGQARGVSGELLVLGPDSLKVHLQRLDLDALTEQVSVDSEKADWIPQALPAIDLLVEQLSYNGRSLGRWQGRIQPVEDGALARDVEVRIGDSLTTGSMHWVYTPANQQHNTVLSFETRGTDFQVLSDAFQLNAPITSAEFRLVGSLVWMDRPDRFDWSQLFGRFDVDMEDGVIRDVAASTNIFRLLGVLNTETLTRRLKLDFSDLYKQGMSYDKLAARTRIQAGVLRFTQPLAIQTPNSAYNLSGSLDLVKDTLDMQMIVALPVSKNLPLAAILLGAPQVGGALFLLDKLLGDPLSNLTTATFDVKGTLADPKVTLKNVMNPRAPQGETK